MTDKAQKIRNEVVRLQNELIQEKKKGFGSDADDACILELQNVLTYIDSLQEEPKQKFKIGDRIKFKGVDDEDVVRTITDIQKYDDGSCRYIFADGSLHSVENNEIIDDTLNLSNVQRTVKNWKEPVSDDLKKAAENYAFTMSGEDEVLKYDAFIEGAQWQKEQMMAKVIDGKVIANGMGNPILHLWDKGRHLIDKKVKVIVIKE